MLKERLLLSFDSQVGCRSASDSHLRWFTRVTLFWSVAPALTLGFGRGNQGNTY